MKKVIFFVFIFVSLLTFNSCEKKQVRINRDLLTSHSWNSPELIKNNYGANSLCTPMFFHSNGTVEICSAIAQNWELINSGETILKGEHEWDIIELNDHILHIEDYYYKDSDRVFGMEVIYHK